MAAIAVVGSVFGDLVQSASSVLVILGVMEASSIFSPGSNTIHWLAASLLSALLEVIFEGTLEAIVVRLDAHSVSPATLVLVVDAKQRPSPILFKVAKIQLV